MKKSKLLSVIVLSSLIFGVGFTAVSCKKGEENNQQQEQYDGPYKLKITAIGSTTINASKTVSLRSSVTGTSEKDVTWSSDNESVATVSEKGLVTGISKGEATITCALVIEPKCKATIKITVLEAVAPTSIRIKGYSSETQWVGEDIRLSIEAEPSEASNAVNWESSDEEVATISEQGQVHFIKTGNVTIKATSKVDAKLFDNVTFAVKEGFFMSSETIGSPYWNLEHQADDEDPYVEIGEDTPAGYHSLYFANAKGQKYYASVTFHVTQSLSGWVWQGIGLGNGLSEENTRYFLFSPVVAGQGNNFQKCIVKTMPNESWPAITERSQIWGENGLNDINYSKPVTISMIRNYNDYYFLINNKMFYFDNTLDYDGIDTMPILNTVDTAAKVTDYVFNADSAYVDSLLDQPQYKTSFYASDPNIVYYDSDNQFSLGSTTTLSKDHKVKSLGDKAKVYGDFEVEFDMKSLKVNEGHIANGFTGLTINFSEYEKADTVHSLMLGRSQVQSENTNYVARFAEWDYKQSMDSATATSDYLESSATVFTNPTATNHVKITRTIENARSTFKMYVNDVEVNFDVQKYAGDSKTTNRYTQAYLIWVAGEYASCDIENFKFTMK